MLCTKTQTVDVSPQQDSPHLGERSGTSGGDCFNYILFYLKDEKNTVERWRNRVRDLLSLNTEDINNSGMSVQYKTTLKLKTCPSMSQQSKTLSVHADHILVW